MRSSKFLRNRVPNECVNNNDLVEGIKQIFDRVMLTQGEDNISALAISLTTLIFFATSEVIALYESAIERIVASAKEDVKTRVKEKKRVFHIPLVLLKIL